MTAWISFFQSSAGASATLIGLVVVAISINLARILEYPHLPVRAAAALAPLVGVLVVTLLGLAPAEANPAFGLETLGVGVLMWIGSLFAALRHHPDLSARRRWPLVALNQAQSLPFVLAGALVMLGRPAGLDWIIPGVIFSLVGGVLNTWVLLVEIVR